jgi:hypothetical protein
MTLTLGNDLTGSVAREVSEASRKSSGLGESLTTGNNKFVEVVDGFLGSSLRDSEIVLGAIAKNTAYSINMLTITDEYLKTVSSALQEGLKVINSAGPLSNDKLATLQKNLDDKRKQVDLLIKSADFDGKALLGGGAKETDVQVGLSITDKLTLKVNDIGSGKLFRSSVTNALNEYLSANAARSNHYAGPANARAFKEAKESNANLVHIGLTANAMTNNEAATAFVEVIRNTPSFSAFLEKALPQSKEVLLSGNVGVGRDFANADAASMEQIFVLPTNAAVTAKTDLIGRNVNDAGDGNADTTATDVANTINGVAVPQAVKDAANAAAAVGGFANHNAARQAVRLAAVNADKEMSILQAVTPRVFTGANGVGAGVDAANVNAARDAILALPNVTDQTKNAVREAAAVNGSTVASVRDAAFASISARNEVLNLLSDDVSTNIAEASNEANRVIAQDVMQSALNTIRAEQASVSNQKQNVIEAADALRATTNVTQKAADSYLKADYVMTAQQYSETIRTMVASITALQAANKIPEAAQRLIDALAR